MKTFDFNLSDPVTFHKDGQTEESTCLTFYAPAVKNRKHVARLKQGFMRAGASLDGEVSEEDKKKAVEARGDDEIKPSEVLAILQMSDKTDYEGYIETFVNLITSGVCKIDDSVPMSKAVLDGISCADLDNAMGEYLVNFILGSLEK